MGSQRGRTVVFSKSYCPYCRASKATLQELGAQFLAIELDQIGLLPRPPNMTRLSGADDGQQIQDALEEITKQRTVPNIFINKQHIGGNSDLQQRKAELPTLLKAGGA